VTRPPFHLALDQVGYALPQGRTLFDGVTLAFADERTGIVGANGSGKSTLARIIAGELAPTTGSVTRHGRIGYLRQEVAPSRDATVASMLGIAEPLAALDRLLAGTGSAGDVERVGAQWDLRERAAVTLERVGLGGLTLERSLGQVSGGEGTRLGLAALLLDEPDLLVLDEPTNHLDADARGALSRVIDEWPRGIVLVSHDRSALAHMERIVELSSVGVQVYGGGFEEYREQRDVERAAAARELEAAQLSLARTKRAVQATRERKARQDAKGRRSRDGGSQPKIVLNAKRDRSDSTNARLAGDAARQLDEQRSRLVAAKARVQERAQLVFSLPPSGLPRSKRVFEANGVSFRHEGCDADLFTALDLSIVGPERLALVGANGTGKSTLLQLMGGTLAPTAGGVSLGVSPERIAALDQKVAWPDPRGSLLDNFQAYNPNASPAFARQALASFLFRGDDALRPVATLSGGEVLRGAMAARLFAPDPPLLLLLDEPTNHLDLESVEAVERALQQYDGALVVVSHDESFLEAVGITRRLERDASGRWR